MAGRRAIGLNSLLATRLATVCLARGRGLALASVATAIDAVGPNRCQFDSMLKADSSGCEFHSPAELDGEVRHQEVDASARLPSWAPCHAATGARARPCRRDEVRMQQVVGRPHACIASRVALPDAIRSPIVWPPTISPGDRCVRGSTATLSLADTNEPAPTRRMHCPGDGRHWARSSSSRQMGW